MIILIIKGILLGMLTAIPVGPIGILIAKRTLTNGKASGVISGTGAALADGIYATIAVFSVGAVSSVLLEYHFYISIIGSIFLLYMGYRIYKSVIPEDFKEFHERSFDAVEDFFSTFFLTITNPTLILSFSAVFASFGLRALEGDDVTKIFLVIGFVLGSFSWFFTLSSIIDRLRNKFTVNTLTVVNHFAGVIIMIFAVMYFLSNFAVTKLIMSYFK